jgi:O-antigen/teichoic acid export membrane protein
LREALNSRPFLRNVSIMLGGTAGGQLVSVLLSPVLTRLYSPEQFGILSVYLAVLSILVVVASLRYELTLPLAESDEDAMNIVAVCACVLVVVTGAVTAASYFIPEAWLMAFWPGGQRTIHLEVFRLHVRARSGRLRSAV